MDPNADGGCAGGDPNAGAGAGAPKGVAAGAPNGDAPVCWPNI